MVAHIDLLSHQRVCRSRRRPRTRVLDRPNPRQSHREREQPRLIAAWLSGYYNVKRNNRVIDLQTLEENMSKVKNYCSDEKNFKVPVMKAVEQILGKGN